MADRSDTGLPSIAEAFALAAREAEGTEPEADAPEAVEAPEAGVLDGIEDAEAAPAEQPVEVEADQEPDDQSVFGELEVDPAAEADEGAAILGAEIEVEGFDGPMTVQKMKDELEGSYLRQADYTKKTQALAEERKAFDTDSAAAKKLFDSLSQDAPATVAYLAEQLGLLEPSDALAEKVKALQGAWQPPLTGEALEAEIEKRVESRLAEHPTVQQAEAEAALAAVDRAIADIEKKFEVKLTDSDKQKLLGRALQANTSDLGLVFSAMKAEADDKRRQRKEAAASATRRPGTREDTDTDKPAKVTSVRDALELALSEQADAA